MVWALHIPRQILSNGLDTGSGGGMVAYEFYIRDGERGNKLIGILPERRNCPERVNQESIMNWARTVFSSIHAGNIFFTRVILEQNGFGNYFPNPAPRAMGERAG
jgi:hypothetical protein